MSHSPRWHGQTGFPPYFFGDVRRRIPLFAAVGAVCIVAAVLPLPPRREEELSIACGLFVALTAVGLLVPWRRTPQWAWPVVPLGYVAVIALLRDSQGTMSSGLTYLYVLPVIWLTLYGIRSHMLVGLVAVALALAVPILAVGPPAYPTSEWRGLFVVDVVMTLVSFTLLSVAQHDRDYAVELTEQSLSARRSERAAVESREQLNSLLDAATGTAVISSDVPGIVTFFSGGAERALGYHAEEVVGRFSIYDFGDPDEMHLRQLEVLALVEAAAAAPGVSAPPLGEESVWTFIRKDGGRRRASISVTSRHENGRLAGFVLVATDVTERDLLALERERLLDAQREVTEVLTLQNRQLRELTQIKDDVVATVSHELRTPLTSIRGFIELLLDGSGSRLDPEELRMLRTIDRSSVQLLRVAEDLLADPGAGQGLQMHFVDTDLALLAREAVDAVATQAADRGLQLDCVADGPVLVRGDPSRLHQLIGNLLTNAIKFSPPGERVEVRAHAIERLAELEVLDNGPGISPEDRSQLFERFYRLDHPAIRGVPGTGLGLAIAKSVVDTHEGAVEIVDTPGWSTTFRVLLPLTQREAAVPSQLSA